MNSPELALQLGAELRRVCGIAANDDTTSIRNKLRSRLSVLVESWDEDQREAVVAALGLRSDSRPPYMDRVSRYASDFRMSQRTAMRRIAGAMHVLAHDLLASDAARAARNPPTTLSEAGYIVEELEVRLSAESSAPVVEERRTIRITDEGSVVTGRFSLPRGAETTDVKLLFGGVLAALDRPHMSHVRYVIKPPSPLQRGERFSYELLIRMPDDGSPRSHYVVQPMSIYDAFGLRVRFDPVRLPRRVWRLDGLLPRMIDDRAPSDEVIAPDSAGQLEVTFQGLDQGRAYGLAWSWSDDNDGRGGSGMESH